MPERSMREYEGELYEDPGGFIILPRQWWDSPFLDDPKYKPWNPEFFWQYLVYLAVWDRNGRTIRRRDEVVHVQRGQLYYSLRYLGKKPGYSKDTVARQLDRWAAETAPDGTPTPRLRREARHEGSVITILNYGRFQDLPFYRQQDVRHTPRRKRDAGETNKNIQTGEVKRIREGAVAHDPNSTPTQSTWRDAVASRDFGIFDRLPEHLQHDMLTACLKTGPPPANLRDWVAKVCGDLDIPFDFPPPPTDAMLRKIREQLVTALKTQEERS